MFHFQSSYAFVSRMCPKVSEKPKKAYKGVTYSVKLDVVKHVWYDLDLGMLNMFSI